MSACRDEVENPSERGTALKLARAIPQKALLALLVVAAVSAVAAPAHAPKYLGLPPLVSGECTLASGEAGDADGSFEVGRFGNDHGQLSVTGMLQAGCLTDSGVTGLEPVPVTFVADVYEATCEAFRFTLQGTTEIKDIHFDFSGSSIDLFYATGDPPSLRRQLCAIARWADQGVLEQRAEALTRMLVDDPMPAATTGAGSKKR